MADLIDRQALYERAATLEAQALDYVGKLIERDGDETSTEWRIWSAILTERTAFKHDVYDAPSADAVEVVRCWNCVWWDNCPSSTITPNFHKCKRVGRMSMPSDGFCSYGERK